MTWLSILSGFLSIVSLLLTRAKDRQAKGEGAAIALGTVVKEALDDLRKLHQTRDEAFRKFDDRKSAGGLPSDLQFRD